MKPLDSYLMRAEGVLGDDHSFVRLVDSMPRVRDGLPPSVLRPGDQRIVDAARTTSHTEAKERTRDEDEKLIRYLVKNRHTTPLEFVRFTFHVRMPIFIARQWVRHRTASINEQSARYAKLDADFYIPTMDRLRFGGQAKSNRQASGQELSADVAGHTQLSIENAGLEAYKRYERLLEHGVAREIARMVLPTNIYTQWYWATDLHNLMHFLSLRAHSHAQWEIQQYAFALVEMAKSIAPIAMAAWEENR